MRIHHFTIPAHDPERVARVLAEILGARVIPIPHPAGTRGEVGAHELELRDAPLPEAWPHHAYVTSDVAEPDQILAVFAREGWKAEKVHNGPPHAGFSLVRGWIENHAGIEIGGRTMREEYERFFAQLAARASAVC
jgi:hypothetical protein